MASTGLMAWYRFGPDADCQRDPFGIVRTRGALGQAGSISAEVCFGPHCPEGGQSAPHPISVI
jgi:hypothetical protein